MNDIREERCYNKSMEEKTGKKQTKADTYPGIQLGLSYCIHTRQQAEWKKKQAEIKRKEQEQERTTAAKKIFLQFWEKSRGIIKITCEKAGVGRSTFYEWKEEDPEFAKALEDVTKNRNDEIEDLLIGKCVAEHSGADIRFYLERRHPAYKPRQVQENVGLNGESIEIQIIKNKDEAKGDNGVPKELGSDGKPGEPDNSQPGGNS